MHLTAVLAMVLVMAQPGSGSSGRPGTTPGRIEGLKLTDALVVIDDTKVPAQAAGVLAELNVDEGADVAAGTLLGKIDDRDVQLAAKSASLDLEIAKLQAASDANVLAAAKTADVAKAEYDKSAEINKQSRGSISAFELARLLLTWERMVFQKQIAELEKSVAEITSGVKSAALEAAQLEMDRRRIDAPVDGVVAEIVRYPGEWVNPGDEVLRMVRMDKLRVKGAVPAAAYAPQQIYNQPTVVEVQLANGRIEQFRGVISYVSPIVEGDGKYLVYCEVENRKDGNFWVLQPGTYAEMTISLGQASRTAANVTR